VTTAVAAAAGLANGTVPEPGGEVVTATFDTGLVTLTGTVPDDAAKARLQTLAIARSGRPVPVNNLLSVDPSVPAGIGVRMLDLTSDQFAPNSAAIDAQHAGELNQTVASMGAFADATLVVVGHSDDGSGGQLAEDRASAVTAYLTAHGIDAGRLAARSVDAMPLPALDDGTSAALGGRVELVYYGLLGP